MDWQPSTAGPSSHEERMSLLLLDVHLLQGKIHQIVSILRGHTYPSGLEGSDFLLDQISLQPQPDLSFLQQGSSSDIDWDPQDFSPDPARVLLQRLDSTMDLIDGVFHRVVLEDVGHQAHLAEKGLPMTRTWDDVQDLCESVLTAARNLQIVLDKLLIAVRTMPPDPFQVPEHNLLMLQERLNRGFEDFLRNTLVVEVPPPQVLKIKTKVTIDVVFRWLVGNAILNQWGAKQLSEVKGDIISESQAKDLFTCHDPKYLLRDAQNPLKPCGQFCSNKSKFTLEDRPDTSDMRDDNASLSPRCRIIFKQLQVNRIDREIKKVKGAQVSAAVTSSLPSHLINENNPGSLITVTDEKFCMLVHVDLELGGKSMLVYTTSPPIVVVSHGVQESQAWLTVTWDNCFFTRDRIPFQVSDSSSWSGEPGVAKMLSDKFAEATGRGLDERQLSVLKLKLQQHFADDLDNPGSYITFRRLAKETIPLIHTSFWEWFWYCLKVTEKHACSEWKSGSLMGFISRSDAELMLEGCPPGTFLLRFSDSVLGGISITFVATSGRPRSITPFTTKNLTFRGLTESVWDLEHLTMLFPNTPKAEAFPPKPPSHQHINFSILKGIYGQQSISPTKSKNKSKKTRKSDSSQGQGSPTKSPMMDTPLVAAPHMPSPYYVNVPSSDYVEFYPRISIDKSFI